MYAQVGDRLIVDADAERVAVIIGVPHPDGSPPYVVKWLIDGHIAMVSPGQFARVIQAPDDAGGPAAGECEGRRRGATL